MGHPAGFLKISHLRVGVDHLSELFLGLDPNEAISITFASDQREVLKDGVILTLCRRFTFGGGLYGTPWHAVLEWRQPQGGRFSVALLPCLERPNFDLGQSWSEILKTQRPEGPNKPRRPRGGWKEDEKIPASRLTVRARLDMAESFAPTLLTPVDWLGCDDHHLDVLMQIAIKAAKQHQLVLEDDDLVELLGDYTKRFAKSHLGGLHPDEEKHLLSDICEELFIKSGPGYGAMALAHADEFRKYFKRVVRFRARSVRDKRGEPTRHANSTERPTSSLESMTLDDVARTLGVSKPTACRRLKKLRESGFLPEVWEGMIRHEQEKESWAEARKALVAHGECKHEAARKRVARAKKKGESPDVFSRVINPQPPSDKWSAIESYLVEHKGVARMVARDWIAREKRSSRTLEDLRAKLEEDFGAGPDL
jgi:hypothetical protein